MQCHAIPCSTMQYHAIPCNTMQYPTVPCNTMQYHAIPCNSMQYYAIQCNTMQYHAILCIINNCWRSVPLPCGQYNGHFFLNSSSGKNQSADWWCPPLPFLEVFQNLDKICFLDLHYCLCILVTSVPNMTCFLFFRGSPLLHFFMLKSLNGTWQSESSV